MIFMNEEEIKEKLKEIRDPNTGKNIIELGIIKGIEINEENKHVYVIMHLPHHMRELESYVESSIKEEIDSEGYKTQIEMMYHS